MRNLPVVPSFVNPDAQLCYVSGQMAWFTTQTLSAQWGDDWNDAPYAFNAGEPYEDDQSPPRWQLYRLMFACSKLEPIGERYGYVSVQEINAGEWPWLVGDPDNVWDWKNAIFAGATVAQMTAAIQAAGGQIYWPVMVEEGE